jgi:hypothetical protein
LDSSSSSSNWRTRLRTLQAALTTNQQLQARIQAMLASVRQVSLWLS